MKKLTTWIDQPMSQPEKQLTKILSALLEYNSKLNMCAINDESEPKGREILEKSLKISELSRWLKDNMPLLAPSREQAMVLSMLGKELDWSFDKPDCPHTAIYLKKRT